MGDDPSYRDNDYDVINTCLVSDETTPSDNTTNVCSVL